jgi:hypothetical protein
MRWLVLVCTLAVAFVVFVAVAAVTSGPSGEPVFPPEHKPETVEEKAAAAVATEYLRVRLRRHELRADGRWGVTDIDLGASAGEARVSGLEPGPGVAVELRRVRGRWQATGHHAYALI